jgi:hypothetical protein
MMLGPMTRQDLLSLVQKPPHTGGGSGSGRPGAHLSPAASAVLDSGDRAGGLGLLAALAHDRALAPRVRAQALLGATQVAAVAELTLPDAACDAVEDALVMDSALQHGLVGALTAALRLRPQAFDVATRRMLGHKLLATGARGPHVTTLLIDARDYPAAVQAAADDFVRSVAPAAGSPNLMALGWAGLALGWLRDRADTVFAPLARELLARGGGAAAALATLIGEVEGAPPAQVAAARALLGQPQGGVN